MWLWVAIAERSHNLMRFGATFLPICVESCSSRERLGSMVPSRHCSTPGLSARNRKVITPPQFFRPAPRSIRRHSKGLTPKVYKMAKCNQFRDRSDPADCTFSFFTVMLKTMWKNQQQLLKPQ